MKSEDKTLYPGRIETQPYTMEHKSVNVNLTDEEIAKLNAANMSTENEGEYAVESNDEYAGI